MANNGIIPIPGPATLPFIGNIADMDKDNSAKTFKRLTKEHGEIFKLDLLRNRIIGVTTHALIDEVCDEKRFFKKPNPVLRELREGIHDGLFTAYLDEPNWGIAHRVLMPAFGPLSIGGMFGEMHDVASQLVLKWARHGPGHKILLTDDFTRLALDTLALCSMGFRFNSYYEEKLHPFIDSMGEFLSESGRKSQRPPLPSWFYRDADQKYQVNIGVLRQTAEDVLKERVANPENGRKDLLAAMLKGRDSLTGEKMSDSSIVDNLITFLIAGHETTSRMLSYACHQLMRHPEAYRKVQEEVDRVIGKGPIALHHIQEFKYIPAVLRESLRIDSPITLFGLSPIEDTVLGGKYEVSKSDSILVLLSGLHNDPKIYDHPEEFRPERMLDENFNKLPKNAWKPFGNGVRACIGRPFAWQEAILAMALVFQNFDLYLDDPDYKLQHKQTLTIKPDHLYAHAKLRDSSMDPTKLLARISGTDASGSHPASGNSHHTKQNETAAAKQGSKMTILYGSNSGTCEALAQSLATNATAKGYHVSRLGAMDEAVKDLPCNDPDHPVVLITASYEGQPPDNAARFVKWIEDAEDSTLNGLKYAVFGCGNHEWAQTFHRVPKLVDERLEKLGAKRLSEIGLADAAHGDVFGEFETWEDEVFWPSLATKGDDGLALVANVAASTLKVKVGGGNIPQPRRNVEETKVLSVRTLTADGEPVKKHIEIQLPPGATYRTGDYLAIMPSNPKASVLRALRRFDLKWDETISVEGSSVTLPTGVTMYARTILSDFVELGQPITKKGVHQLAEAATNPEDTAELKALSEDDAYASDISAKRVSMLDLLERYSSIKMELGAFLALLPPMRVRQYSIASSPLSEPSSVTIVYSVLQEQAKSGQGTYYGVASSYLSSLQTGDPIHVAVRASNVYFHPPAAPESEPVILVAAGTGLAPFRGFVQERAALAEQGKELAPAILYYGCRGAERDDLYAEEFAKWEAAGVVTVRRAYSRDPGTEYKYVQDVLAAHSGEVSDLWKRDAKVYVCGSRAISQAVDGVAMGIKKRAVEERGEEVDEAAIKEWWDGLRNIRYVSDVFD